MLPIGAAAGADVSFTLTARTGGGAWTAALSDVFGPQAAAAVRPFSLSGPRARVLPALVLPPLGPSSSSEAAAPGGRKRPWLAGFEVLNFNLGLWAYSRYIAKEDWAYISWETVKANFRNGFEYDDDGLFTNLFMHPYNGLHFYNAARSLGMTFLESGLYTLGGSLVWEMFLENQYPSTNDLVTTVAGGVYVGEVAYRMSSLVLDDSATGRERTWREIMAFLINPMRGLNRLILGEARRKSGVNRQLRPPVEGHLALTSAFVLNEADPPIDGAGTALELDFIYGERFIGRSDRKPFDMILFNTGLRMAGRRANFHVDSHALVWGWERQNGKGRGHLFGLFQHYDFLTNEEIEMGGTSLAGGVVSFFPLSADRKLDLRTSAQLGVTLLSATDNLYLPVTGSEYHYGMGPMAKFDARLSHERWGWLSLRFNHYRNHAIQGKNSADRRSHDLLSVLKAQYGVTVRRGLGFRVEYASYFRRNYFQGFPPTSSALSHIGLSFILSFS